MKFLQRWRGGLAKTILLFTFLKIMSDVLVMYRRLDHEQKSRNVRSMQSPWYSFFQPMGRVNSEVLSPWNAFIRSLDRVDDSRVPKQALEIANGENVKVPSLDIYIMSAIHHHYTTPPKSQEFGLVLVGYRHRWVTTKISFVCCFAQDMSSHGDSSSHQLHEAPARYTGGNVFMGDLLYAEYKCSTPARNNYRYVFFARKCSTQLSRGLNIDYVNMPDTPRPGRALPPVSVAVCQQMAYGYMPPQQLVEWFEFQRLVGVSKVHVFYHKDYLDTRVLAVLRCYEQIGMATLKQVTPAALQIGAMKDLSPATINSLPSMQHQFWSDMFTVHNDCRRRLAAYTYIMDIDFDEFVVPEAPYNTLNSALEAAGAAYPFVSNFELHSYTHVLNWGVSKKDASLFHLQFLNQTTDKYLWSEPLDKKSSPKVVYVPNRTTEVHIHDAVPLSPYKSYRIPENYVKFHHYRNCKPYNGGSDCSILKRIPALDLLRFQDDWEEAVEQRKSQ